MTRRFSPYCSAVRTETATTFPEPSRLASFSSILPVLHVQEGVPGIVGGCVFRPAAQPSIMPAILPVFALIAVPRGATVARREISG